MGHHSDTPKFELGQLVATPGALAAIEDADQTPFDFLQRHVRGDWGHVDVEDAGANDAACAYEDESDRRSRVLSAYKTTLGISLWVITEADRSVTTILLPDEY